MTDGKRINMEYEDYGYDDEKIDDRDKYVGVDDDGYETEEVDADDAVMDGMPKSKIFFNVIGIIILIAGIVVLGYFQYEQLQIAKNTPLPNITYSMYDSSCDEGNCLYKLKNQLPKELECFYKGNKTECSKIIFDFSIKGTKQCIEGLCTFNVTEGIDKCSFDGGVISCEEIVVKRK